MAGRDAHPDIEERKLGTLNEYELGKYLSDWSVHTCSFCKDKEWTTKEHIAGTFFFKPKTHLKEHQRKGESADTTEQKFKDWIKTFKELDT